MNEKMKLKTKALRIFFIFLALMLILTFVSRGIYSYRLPRVSLTSITNQSISYTVKSYGTLESSKILPTYALSNLRIEEVCVKQGDTVAVDDVLLKYDTEYLEEYVRKLSRQIEIDKLTRADYYKAEAWNNAKIVDYSIEEMQQELSDYQALLDNGAVLFSKMDGIITAVNAGAGDLTSETAAFLIADMSGSLYFSADISEEDAKRISAGSMVNLNFRNGEVLIEDCKIASIMAADSENMYRVVIPLEQSELTVGEVGQLSASVMSEEHYDCIPLEAVHTESVQSYVYILEESEGFLGMEYRISKCNIIVAEQNETYAGVENSGIKNSDAIVLDSTKELYDGEAVRLKK